MELIALKSKRVNSGDSLKPVILQALSEARVHLSEGDILVVASKIVAYSQGLLKPVQSTEEFKELIRAEADEVLDEGEMVLTLKNKVLIPNAGIDNSNTPEGEVVLWPSKPFEAARELHSQLMAEFSLSQLGIVISDSHCQPLRMGTSGIAIGWAGFEGVQDERGKKDLFEREMVYTKMAVADNLSSAANLLMGETNASTPLVLVRGFEASFTERKQSELDSFVEPSECIYSPLYSKGLRTETDS